jgi:uncharacterized protein YlxP (DUF503 family)
MSVAHILYAEFQLSIPYSHSLKQRRQVVQGLRDRVRNQFNVSIAEVANQDNLQLAGFAVVMVGGKRAILEQQMSALEAFVMSAVDAEVLWLCTEWL